MSPLSAHTALHSAPGLRLIPLLGIRANNVLALRSKDNDETFGIQAFIELLSDYGECYGERAGLEEEAYAKREGYFT